MGKNYENQRLLRLKASDGSIVSSLLVTKKYNDLREILNVPILLQIHGILGHFLARGTPRLLPHSLLEHGFNSMSINTRLAFAGQITGKGIFDDTVNDIGAAVDFLQKVGFKRIYILGYSLGASMLANWAANRQHEPFRGLILEGIHYSTSEAHRSRLIKWSGSPSYDEIYAKAKSILGKDPYNSKNDETFIIYKSRGPTREPVNNDIFTYKTWWFMMGPHADGSKAHKHIPNIDKPLLFMRGESDPHVEQWEINDLVKIAKESGNENIRSITVPGAGHDCMENPDVMLNEIVDFINSY